MVPRTSTPRTVTADPAFAVVHPGDAIETKSRLESLTRFPETTVDMRRRPYNIDLTKHLAQCDGNYLRISRLMPDIRRTNRRRFRIFRDAHAPLVTIEVVERSRYTTVLTVCQEEAGRGVSATRLKVRLYHDTRCAEVIEYQGQRRFQPVYRYPNAEMRQPDEKAQVNRFLGEFLDACLRHGVANEELVMIGS